MPLFHGLINHDLLTNDFQCFNNILLDFGDCRRLNGTDIIGDRASLAPSEIATSSIVMDRSFSLNSGRPKAEERGGVSASETASVVRRESLKKRKAEIIMAEDCKEERIEEEAEERRSAVTAKSDGGISANTSKESSKVFEVQKPDYIHVRARRGQATDSHSLAERARREKIKKKMKFLQDLVPGCDKVTGKAGMLDEIINYVQCLQRQVEFLSMKLTALNPSLDFKMENFITEFPAYTASFPTASAQSEMPNLAYLQFHQAKEVATGCGIDMPINPTQITPQTATSSSSLSFSEAYPDSTCLPQIQSLPTWGSDLQNLCNFEFY